MSAMITQYLMPFGAFQHESANNETRGLYKRIFDPVQVKIINDSVSKSRAGTIKFDLYEGVSLIDQNGVEIQIPTSEREFYRVLSDYSKIEEFPKDMEILELNFQGSDLSVSIFPHEYSEQLGAEIYVPEFEKKVRLRRHLLDFLLDFCVAVESSRKYLSYRGQMINL